MDKSFDITRISRRLQMYEGSEVLENRYNDLRDIKSLAVLLYNLRGSKQAVKVRKNLEEKLREFIRKYPGESIAINQG